MRITLAQLNYHIGNFESNFEKISKAVEKAVAEKADLVVFPELAVCGYPPRDFLEFEDFIDKCRNTINKIAAQSGDIGIIIGAPTKNPRLEGKDLFNSALFLADGQVKHVVNKALLPTYDIFDEFRYFEPGSSFDVIEWKGVRIALSICEDLWNINDNPMYTICPMDEMIKSDPDIIINISASPFDHSHARERIDLLKANSKKYELPVFYVNHVGSQTEIIFDGGSLVLNQHAAVVDELPYFEEEIRTYELDDVKASSSEINNELEKDKIKLIHDGLILGISDYFSKMGFETAILGLSGGIDSSVTLALAAEALGKENVRAIMLPSAFSSEHSISDSEQLVANLGVKSEKIPINELYKTFLEELKPFFDGMEFNIAEENIQARSRAIILMALANKFNYILLNTTNKSEMAVGYGTLYGDLSGGLSVLGDVYKTQIYELAKYINRENEIIPAAIIDKEPSAELKPDQKDSDSLPEYKELDQILEAYIEDRKSPNDLKVMGFDEALVDQVMQLVNVNEYKRYQTAPVLRVSPKAFGMGRRMPIVAKYL
ncbi:MAG: NAD+ synthase [Bacteroidetes bacterium]|nr:NAD+ synthase [Bacteroidota bacterium]